MLETVLAVLSFGISVTALVRTHVEARRTSARGVLVTETFVTGILTPTNTPQVIVRNDGPRAVSLVSLEYAYGQARALDKNTPTAWATTRLPHPAVLRPGEEHVTPVPSLPPVPPGGLGVVGPVALVRDDGMRLWRVTKQSRRGMTNAVSGFGWRPLGRAVERWSLLARLDERIETEQIRKREEHPGALPIVPVIVDLLWGWRAGGSGPGPHEPDGAPRRWRYANGAYFSQPKVDPIPTYPWGPNPYGDVPSD